MTKNNLRIRPKEKICVFPVTSPKSSDFILDFGKLPFSLNLGKMFIHFGKIITKIHKIGKIKTIFGLGMTRL